MDQEKSGSPESYSIFKEVPHRLVKLISKQTEISPGRNRISKS
jgi:hypothetical protein